MVCGRDNILLATTVFFMIPLIVLSFISYIKYKNKNRKFRKNNRYSSKLIWLLFVYILFCKRAKYRWKIYIIKYIFKIINTTLYSYNSILFSKNNFIFHFYKITYTRNGWSKYFVYMFFLYTSKNNNFYPYHSLCNIIKN